MEKYGGGATGWTTRDLQCPDVNADFHRRALRFDVLAHSLETHAPPHTIFPNARSKLRNNGNPQTVSTIFAHDQATRSQSAKDLLL